MARETQMTLVDRSIFVAIALFLFLLCVILIATVLGWDGIGSARAIALEITSRPIETVVCAIALLLGGLHLLFYALHSERDEGIRQETEMGHVRISLRAIENLVYRTARTVRGIKDVEAKVHPSPEGVAISLSLVVHPELQIPRLSEEVSQRVRVQVRETVGVTVGDVSVEIRNIVDEVRARVE